VNAFDMIVRCIERQNPEGGDSVWSRPAGHCIRCGDVCHFSSQVCAGCRLKDQYELVMGLPS
jgi:hypothetical protein